MLGMVMMALVVEVWQGDEMVAARVARDAGDGVENLPKKERGEGGVLQSNFTSSSVPTVFDKDMKMILQDILQVSLVGHKSREEQEARENVELVNKHLASEEIEKMMEGSENVIDDILPPRNDEPNIPGTRLEPRSDKESPKVEITNDEERREKWKIVEESRSTPFPTPIRSPRIHTDLVSWDTEKL
ncbi:hypothetical protein Tco_0780941 [Tanacetum coccineum]